jgi:hypothetical protein
VGGVSDADYAFFADCGLFEHADQIGDRVAYHSFERAA